MINQKNVGNWKQKTFRDKFYYVLKVEYWKFQRDSSHVSSTQVQGTQFTIYQVDNRLIEHFIVTKINRMISI